MYKNSIQVRNVYKNYHKKENILNGINLTVKIGEIYALIGASGCGKTTLLNCMMGMYKIDSGKIEIFNQNVEFKKTSKLANSIGFMSQQISFVSQLTIQETLEYFGNLHFITRKALKERILSISELLELPSLKTFVGNLSNSEKRRVSFAATIIHIPKLLILDEPTVGLDLEFGNKIWNFFNEQTSKNNLTILITTHCMNEVAKADCCGFMMNGKLIVEEKPNILLEKFNVETLYEVYYLLCLNSNQYQFICEENDDNALKLECRNTEFYTKFRLSIIKGIIVKDFHRFKRSFTEIFLIFMTMFVLSWLHITLLGQYPDDIKLGIINHENFNCKNETVPNECGNLHFSCSFLGQINGVKKIFYESNQKAFQDFKKSRISSLMIINENFTNSLINKTFGAHDIEVFLDYSKYHFAIHLKIKIFLTLRDYLLNLTKHCEITDYFMNPYKIEEFLSVKSELDFNFSIPYAPNAIILYSTIAIMTCSVLAIIQCRKCGDWNRSLLNGVQITEIVAAIVFQYLIFAFIISMEAIFCLTYIFKIEFFGNVWLAFILIYIYTINAFLFGFNLSLILDDITSAGYLTMCLFSSLNYISGVIW
ncbi:hypothetical protein PVAND_003272 [Polypedilum vanderplanki]|nr:hypothetical protein PVAND_003272 [Polypedilum vanderplanki]